jgi:hypothetical protein
MMINYDKYYFCENRITDLSGDGKTYNLINERTTYRKHRDLFAYVMEVCNKLDMKVLKTLAVSSPYKDKHEFYNLKDVKTESGTFPKDVAVALTYNGFINAVLWVADYEGEQTYLYSTNKEMLQKGNYRVMKSKNLRPMVRKILDKGHPVTDYSIICNCANHYSSNDTEDLYKHMAKNVGDESKILSSIKSVSLNGRDLQKALELAMSEDTSTRNKTDNGTIRYLQSTLDKFKELDEELKQSRSSIQDALSSPTYLLLTNYLCDDNECVVVKCIPEDNKRYAIDSVKYCSDINDYTENELLLGVINMYKVSNQDKLYGSGEIKRINEAMAVDSYNRDHYDSNTKVGVLSSKRQRRPADFACVYVGLYLLNM